MKNAVIIENGYATLAYPGGHQITTTRLVYDRYVRINDRRHYPQLCAGGYRTGATLVYHSDEQLAKDCGARLYRTRAGFDAAARRLTDDAAFVPSLED